MMYPYRSSPIVDAPRAERSALAKMLTRFKRKAILFGKDSFKDRFTRCVTCKKPSRVRNNGCLDYAQYDCGHDHALFIMMSRASRVNKSEIKGTMVVKDPSDLLKIDISARREGLIVYCLSAYSTYRLSSNLVTWNRIESPVLPAPPALISE